MCCSRNCVRGQAQGGRGLLDQSPHSLLTNLGLGLAQVDFGHCLCLGFSLGLSFGTGFGLRFGTGFSLGLVDLGRCLGFGLGLVLGFGLSQVDLGGYCLGFGCRCDRPFDHNNHHHSRVDTKVSIMLFATMS